MEKIAKFKQYQKQKYKQKKKHDKYYKSGNTYDMDDEDYPSQGMNHVPMTPSSEGGIEPENNDYYDPMNAPLLQNQYLPDVPVIEDDNGEDDDDDDFEDTNDGIKDVYGSIKNNSVFEINGKVSNHIDSRKSRSMHGNPSSSELHSYKKNNYSYYQHRSEKNEINEDFSPQYSDSLRNAIPKIKKYTIDLSKLECLEQIGVGSSSKVYRAIYNGSSTVALKKCLIIDLLDDPLDDYLQETSLMESLNHPNVVKFIGASIKSPYFYMLFEYCEYGSLDQIIHYDTFVGSETGENEHGNIQKWKKIHDSLSVQDKLKMLHDLSLGMAYLSKQKPPIIHRDLKLANLLVNKELNIKITDFGVSKRLEPQIVKTNNSHSQYGKLIELNGDKVLPMPRVGTIETCSPEVLEKGYYSVQSDVYSFGIIMHEILFETALYANMSVHEVQSSVVSGERPEIPPNYEKLIPGEIIDLMKQCWHQNPKHRPSFDQISQKIEDIIHQNNTLKKKSSDFTTATILPANISSTSSETR